MPRIFISYSRVDRPFVDDFVPLVRDVWGYENVWFDDNLHGGQIWWEEILSQIAACDLFVYLLSNDSVTSDYCQAEYQEAQRLQKQILPVQIRARTNIPEDLKRIQFVDMSAGIRPQGLNKFHAAVSRLSGRVTSTPPQTLDSQPVPIPSVSSPNIKLKRKFRVREDVLALVGAIVLIGTSLELLNYLNSVGQYVGFAGTGSPTTAIALAPTDESGSTPTVEVVPSDTFTPLATSEPPTFMPSPTHTPVSQTATNTETNISTLIYTATPRPSLVITNTLPRVTSNHTQTVEAILNRFFTETAMSTATTSIQTRTRTPTQRELPIAMNTTLVAESGPAEIVELYLEAKVEADREALQGLLCTAMEQSLDHEATAFSGVEARLEEVDCTYNEDTKTVTCTGQIVANYSGDDLSLPLGMYSVAQEGGRWKWCGFVG